MKKLKSYALCLLIFTVFVNLCYPDTSAIMEKNAKEYFINKDWNKAIEAATAWKEQAEKAPAAYFLLAYAHYAKGNYREIPHLLQYIDAQDKMDLLLTWVEKFVLEYPQNSAPYLLKGDIYIRLKKYSDAAKELDRAQELEPGLFLIHLARGALHSFQNNYDLAMNNFSEAIRLEPGFADAYINRGIVYYCQENCESALSDFDQAIKIRPDFALAYRGRAMAYRCLGRDDLASDDFRRAGELPGEGGHFAYTKTMDPSTGKITKNVNFGFDISPKIAVKGLPGASLDLGHYGGINSEPEGTIRKIRKGGEGEEVVVDSKLIVPALSFLLHNGQVLPEAGK